MKRICGELNIDTKKFDPRSILSEISNAKNALLTPAQYSDKANSMFENMVARAYKLYQQELEANQALDFDDLIMTHTLLDGFWIRPKRLFACPEIAHRKWPDAPTMWTRRSTTASTTSSPATARRWSPRTASPTALKSSPPAC